MISAILLSLVKGKSDLCLADMGWETGCDNEINEALDSQYLDPGMPIAEDRVISTLNENGICAAD